MNKVIKILDKMLNLIIFIILILAIGFGGYAIYDSFCVYNNAALPRNINQYKPNENEKFSLTNLQEINEDICRMDKIR